MNQRHTANATEPKSYRCAFRHSVHESVLSTDTLGRVDAGTVTRSALGVGMFTKVPELRKTVLVVVREPELRTRFSRFIEQTGFAVVEVDCHKKAWTILEMRSDVQVVFADLDAENGSEKFELARKVYQRWPSMGVLLTSGRIRFVSPSAVPGNGCFLPRPLPADILVSEMTLAADQGQCRSRYQPTTRSDGASN